MQRSALLAQQQFDAIAKCGQVLLHNAPESIDVDLKIVVHQNVAHSDRLGPHFAGMPLAKL